ncbi:hypothetical protein ACQP2X_39545 [Actinoplanes sp. CA-131856]
MPIRTPTGWLIRRVVVHVKATAFTRPLRLDALFDDDIRPDPRLRARPGSDPADLAASQPDEPLRCAGGPIALIDIADMRRHAERVAANRYRRWCQRPTAIDLRAWERELAASGSDAYVAHLRARALAGDALIVLGGPERLCPRDTSLDARRRYADDVADYLDALPSNDQIIAALV